MNSRDAPVHIPRVLCEFGDLFRATRHGIKIQRSVALFGPGGPVSQRATSEGRSTT